MAKARSTETLIRLLIAKDPRRSAETILEFLMLVNRAAAAAVFTVAPELGLFVGFGVTQEVLDWTRERWDRERESLVRGLFSRSDDCMLAPLMHAERIVALLYMKASALDMESLAEASALITDAVARSTREAAPASPVEAYLEQTPVEEIQRRKLELLLNRFEWNVARVAREMNITRTTVYKRLAEWHIERRRVRKDKRSSRYAPTL